MHSPGNSLFETEFSSAFGRIRLRWRESISGPKVVRITLPEDARAEHTVSRPAIPVTVPEDEEIRSLISDIQSFLEGNDVVFRTGILDMDRCPQFQQRVLFAEHAIPRGYVSTYGRIARHLGIPGGARAMGNALAKNPFPIVIPCHRALRANGDPGGFQGGKPMKITLLEMEGAKVRPNGRILMEHIWY